MQDPPCEIGDTTDSHVQLSTSKRGSVPPGELSKHRQGHGEANLTATFITTSSTTAKDLEISASREAMGEVDPATTSTSVTAVDNRKQSPQRSMILTGMPTPALPPRPVFPTELDHYQTQGLAHGLSPECTVQMQAYLSSLRHDYERQLKDYDLLKNFVKEDKFFATALVDELDALDEDPFTLDSFENLMRLHASKGKDFILARVTTQDPNHENKLYHSYYGAHQINKVLFRTQPDEGLLHRMKARNPLNNMLVVGDVHYYIISAQDVNAIKPLPVVRSSSASISSHSSRMSRCSKLAAQAIASQSASARSSPILGNDVSLFSRTSEVESPVSIIPPLMAMSILKADREDGSNININISSNSSCNNHSTGVAIESQANTPGLDNSLPSRRRRSIGSSHSSSSSTSITPNVSQSGFQPGKPSRLRQTFDDDRSNQQASESSTPSGITQDPLRHGELDIDDSVCSPTSPPTQQQNQHSYQHQTSSSPLFQSLMNGRVRGRSNTMSSVHSDKSTASSSSSIASAVSDCSHLSKCSTATDATDATDATEANDATEATDAIDASDLPSGTGHAVNGIEATDSMSVSSPRTPSSPDTEKIQGAIYNFRYLASDDDFLLRSAIRQVFKVNALESWDAILFTISHNALREYSSNNGNGGGAEPPLPPLPALLLSSNGPPAAITTNTGTPPQEQQSQDQGAAHDAVPGRAATESGLEDSDAAASQQRGSGTPGSMIGMSRSMPSLPSAGASYSASTTALPSSSSSSSLSSSSSIASSSSGSTSAATSGTTRLSKHDSGHASTSSLPGEDGFTTSALIASASVGRRPRQPASTAFSSFSVSTGDERSQEQQRRVSGGKKIRQAFNKIFSL